MNKHNFVVKAAPLTRLLRKESTIYWGATQEKSFQELKYTLTHTPVLAFPDYEALFIMGEAVTEWVSTLGWRASGA